MNCLQNPLVNNGYRMHLIDTWDAEHFQAAWKFKQGISLPEIGPPMGFFNGYGAQKNKGFKNSYDSRLSRDSGDDPLPASHIHQNPWSSNIMGVIEEGILTWGPIELTELFDLSNVYPKRSMLHHLPQFPPIADEEFWLGGLSGETVAGNEQLFDLEDPGLRRLWAQAQVFGGRFDFTGDSHRKMLIEEITAWLKEWTAAKATSGRSKIVWLEDAEKMLKQLHAHSQETARFASTDLGRIFASLKSS